MKRAISLFAAAAVAGSCTHASRSPVEILGTASPPARVLLLSYDGVGADPFEKHLKSGRLRKDGFALAAVEGTRIRRVVPVTPTLTSVAHIAIATGAPPEQTGIVSNTFHRPGDPIDVETSGFNEEIDTETIWEAAKRQGKRVGTITFPGLDWKNSRRSADWGLVYSEPISDPRVVLLRRTDFRSVASRTSLPHSFSEPLASTITWDANLDGRQLSFTGVLTAVDSTDDAVTNYDRFFALLENGDVTALDHSWFPVWKDISIDGETYRFGSWSKVLDAEPTLSEVRVYLGAVSRTLGHPTSFRRMIDERVGFWPGPPDAGVSRKWLRGDAEGIHPDLFAEQLERFSRFFTDATLLSMAEMQWDLILAYQPIIDEAEHQFLLESPGQLVQDPVKVAEARRVREHAYRVADASFARYVRSLPADAAIVATGDHGLAPAEKIIRLNRQLADWGLAAANDGQLDPSSRWAAFSSGSFAHIYAFAPIQPGERDALIGKLRQLRDDEGTPVFEMVRAKTATDHANAGDVVVAVHPRFSISSSMRPGPIFSRTEHFGQHGGLNHHPEYHTMLLAYGHRVKKQMIDRIAQTSIARYVSELLGIEAPRSAQ